MPKPAPIELPDWLPADEWKGFCDHMRALKAIPTEQAQKLWLKDLTEFRDQGDDPVAVLHQSIKHGWRGVYRVKSSPWTQRSSASIGPVACADCAKEVYGTINGRCFECYVLSKRRKAVENL